MENISFPNFFEEEEEVTAAGSCHLAQWQALTTDQGNPFFQFPSQYPLPLPLKASFSGQFVGNCLPSTSVGGPEDQSAATASKSHSQAEKHRRDRINAHLATLRKLIPKSDKMDKAALLESAVQHLKELKRKTLEVSKKITIPTDIDEVTITDCRSDQGGGSLRDCVFIRASICCDDRPELFSELNHGMETLGLRIIRVEMNCLGGRIRSSFVLCTNDGNRLNGGGGIDTVKHSLKVMLSRIVDCATSSSCRMKSKRQRFFFTSFH